MPDERFTDGAGVLRERTERGFNRALDDADANGFVVVGFVIRCLAHRFPTRQSHKQNFTSYLINGSLVGNP